jgi:hypothetical protein
MFNRAFLIAACLVTACGEPGLEAQAGPSAPGIFTDVTLSAGVRFRHNSGAYGKKYLPETMGSGCAFVDVDGDGWQDILLVNGMNWPGRPGPASVMALYRNNRQHSVRITCFKIPARESSST